jgi:hypothetical protein
VIHTLGAEGYLALHGSRNGDVPQPSTRAGLRAPGVMFEVGWVVTICAARPTKDDEEEQRDG